MTTREQAQKLLDGPPDSELGPIVEILSARGKNGTAEGDGSPQASTETPSVPESWGWEKTAWGEPMPNVVAWVDDARQGR
jgi:hypothetical protein